jgi:RmlD substrate binding domain
MTVVVTGGMGGLGTELVIEVMSRGADVIPASRRTGFDLATGEGVAEVLADADIIVHAASHPLRLRRVDLGAPAGSSGCCGTPAGARMFIYVSIVGCDRKPDPYYRAKYACEIVLRMSGLPVTVLRATEFHNLIGALARIARWPLALSLPNAALSHASDVGSHSKRPKNDLCRRTPHPPKSRMSRFLLLGFLPPSSPLLNSKHHHHQRDDDHSSLDNGQEGVECDGIQQFISDRFTKRTDESEGAKEH